jgi:hypothetical protein
VGTHLQLDRSSSSAPSALAQLLPEGAVAAEARHGGKSSTQAASSLSLRPSVLQPLEMDTSGSPRTYIISHDACHAQSKFVATCLWSSGGSGIMLCPNPEDTASSPLGK